MAQSRHSWPKQRNESIGREEQHTSRWKPSGQIYNPVAQKSGILVGQVDIQFRTPTDLGLTMLIYCLGHIELSYANSS